MDSKKLRTFWSSLLICLNSLKMEDYSVLQYLKNIMVDGQNGLLIGDPNRSFASKVDLRNSDVSIAWLLL